MAVRDHRRQEIPERVRADDGGQVLYLIVLRFNRCSMSFDHDHIRSPVAQESTILYAEDFSAYLGFVT